MIWCPWQRISSDLASLILLDVLQLFGGFLVGRQLGLARNDRAEPIAINETLISGTLGITLVNIELLLILAADRREDG